MATVIFSVKNPAAEKIGIPALILNQGFEQVAKSTRKRFEKNVEQGKLYSSKVINLNGEITCILTGPTSTCKEAYEELSGGSWWTKYEKETTRSLNYLERIKRGASKKVAALLRSSFTIDYIEEDNHAR